MRAISCHFSLEGAESSASIHTVLLRTANWTIAEVTSMCLWHAHLLWLHTSIQRNTAVSLAYCSLQLYDSLQSACAFVYVGEVPAEYPFQSIQHMHSKTESLTATLVRIEVSKNTFPLWVFFFSLLKDRNIECSPIFCCLSISASYNVQQCRSEEKQHCALSYQMIAGWFIVKR